MENQRRCLLDELNRAQGLARQLQASLGHPSTIPVCKNLAQEILSCIEKAVSLAKPSSLEDYEISEQGTKEQKRRDLTKRRKASPTWTKLVRVSEGQGSEEDGYQWRKYGEKEILRAKHPRSYYRCTQRSSSGCLATKQVQKTDEDPSVLRITYYGVHSCTHQRLTEVQISCMKEEEEEEEEEEEQLQHKVLKQEHHNNEQQQEEEKQLNIQSFLPSANKLGDEASSSFSFSFDPALGSSSSTIFEQISSQSKKPELGDNMPVMLDMDFMADTSFSFADTTNFFSDDNWRN
ncbi:WRKY domain-containing protein [Dioscorea alata]|uniref:WRKY domain-containing protein n=1 Tax=Dioscorea alata TaxID=55571 RepID=A0ACB7WDQ0_DIOAL|nr:WRKY domain-containing protein [Dioscorea alata]